MFSDNTDENSFYIFFETDSQYDPDLLVKIQKCILPLLLRCFEIYPSYREWYTKIYPSIKDPERAVDIYEPLDINKLQTEKRGTMALDVLNQLLKFLETSKPTGVEDMAEQFGFLGFKTLRVNAKPLVDILPKITKLCLLINHDEFLLFKGKNVYLTTFERNLFADIALEPKVITSVQGLKAFLNVGDKMTLNDFSIFRSEKGVCSNVSAVIEF
jgi:hypothetical protein